MNTRTILTLLVAACLPACAPPQQAAPTIQKPNVLFIAVDDLNDWTGALGGHPQSRTPNLDRLAERGVLFTSAHCAAPACNPSRAAIMTGIPPYRSGVYHNPQPWRDAMPDAVTIPQHFMAHGYSAAGSGKIYHGPFPDPPSWQDYWPSQQKNKPDDPVPPNRPVNGLSYPGQSHVDWGPVQVPDSEMGDAQVADWISAQLQKKHDKPFFLACGFYRPHLPWYAPQKYFDKYPVDKIILPKVKEDDLDDVPEAGVRIARPEGDHKTITEGGQWHHAVQGYLASVNFVDAQIGRVLDALDRSPYRNNTVVVLWTDHGWHLGEKLHWRKFTLWEEATRTPLMFVVPRGVPGLPGGAPSGVRVDRPVSLMDIYPTLIDLCGLKPRNELSGRSLAPLLENAKAEWDRPAVTTHGRNNHAVRSDRWRYIRYSDGTEELYDHEVDEYEWTNLANDPKRAEIKNQLAKWLPETNVPDAKRQPKKKAEKKKRR